MSEPVISLYEEEAKKAFDAQAPAFDMIYAGNPIIHYKRNRVREHVLSLLKPGDQILELNAGTGEDAIFFAKNGHQVHATDLSTGMLEVLRNKVESVKLTHMVSTEVCSYTHLENLQRQGPYDFIFSNFAGLNCTNELHKVMDSFNPLLNKGGFVTLVLLPKFCLWESLMVFKGKFRTAFRRFSGRKGAAAKIDENHFRCWYYNPSFIINYLKPGFELVKLEGLCTIVPPSYMENFSEKRPGLFRYLVKKENKLNSRWPWRSIGDYYIITLRKK